jgi:cell division protein FtsA
VLDYAAERNTGYSGGAVVDQKQFNRALQRVVGDIRKRNRLKIRNLHITFSAPFVSYYNHFVTVHLPPRRRVTQKMVEEAILSSRKEISSLVEHVIEVVPVRYALDSIYSGNEPPLGFEGSQLGIELMFITAPSASLDQIEHSIRDAGYSVTNWWYSGISAAESVMIPSSEAGVAVVDIGAGSTDVSVYQHGRLLHVGVLERGGRDVDADLAVYLNESITVAEEVKRKYGCALPQVIKHNEFVDVRDRGPRNNKLVPARDLAMIIRNRAQEILYAVDEEIGKAISPELISRIIFTGGIAKIPGFIDLAEEVLDRSAEMGLPCAVNGTRLGFTDPGCASLIGTLRILRKMQVSKYQLDPAAMTSVQKIRSWFGALVSAPASEQQELL